MFDIICYKNVINSLKLLSKKDKHIITLIFLIILKKYKKK